MPGRAHVERGLPRRVATRQQVVMPLEGITLSLTHTPTLKLARKGINTLEQHRRHPQQEGLRLPLAAPRWHGRSSFMPRSASRKSRDCFGWFKLPVC